MVRVLRDSDEEEMVAVFLRGELTSERFGQAVREALVALNRPEELITAPDLADQEANSARRSILAKTRGYGESRELFEFFPARVEWMWTQIQPTELAAVRYIEYSYWNELSGGSRLAVDAARRIDEGVRPFGVSNARFRAAADAVRDGVRFPPLILAGPLHNELVCLEGNLRLTAYALAGFPVHLECLTGVSPALRRWAD